MKAVWETDFTEQAAAIMAHYGAEHQKDILIEECAELIQAVEKSRRGVLAEVTPATLTPYDSVFKPQPMAGFGFGGT